MLRSIFSKVMTLVFCVLPFILHADKNELHVKRSSSIPVVFDGNVSKFEYCDAERVNFKNGHGLVTAYVKSDGKFIYFAFEIPDTSVFPGDDIVVMLDANNMRPEKPNSQDVRAYIRRKPENSRMHRGNGNAWADYWGKWEYRCNSYDSGWEIECRIPVNALTNNIFSKAPENKTDVKNTKMGISFRIWDNEPRKKWTWPSSSDEEKPRTWGTMVIEY